MTPAIEIPGWRPKRLLGVALGVAILGCLGCAGVGEPVSWVDYYDPSYPDHRIAYELCEALDGDENAFSDCMEDAVAPYPDRRTVLSRPGISRR